MSAGAPQQSKLQRMGIIIGILVGLLSAALPMSAALWNAAANSGRLELRLTNLEQEIRTSKERDEKIAIGMQAIASDIGEVKGQTKAIISLLGQRR